MSNTEDDGDGICYMPREHRPFIEVVMRMLDQDGELDDGTLEDVHGALRRRLRVEEGEPGRRDVTQDAYEAIKE